MHQRQMIEYFAEKIILDKSPRKSALFTFYEYNWISNDWIYLSS